MPEFPRLGGHDSSLRFPMVSGDRSCQALHHACSTQQEVDADMASLVRSAARPEPKERMQRYLGPSGPYPGSASPERN